MRASGNVRRVVTAALALALVSVATASAAAAEGEAPDSVVARVEKALSDANIEAAAEKATDFDVLAGLAVLYRGASGERIFAKAREISPELAFESASLFAPRQRVGAAWIDSLVENDPENALGHYLKAALAAESGSALDAISLMRKGESCAKLEPRDARTAQAVIKAFDALGLSGPDRLYALMEADNGRLGIWYSLWQLPANLEKCAGELAAPERVLAAELLFSFAGHVIALNGRYAARVATKNALKAALSLKAGAGENPESPEAVGYRKVLEVVEAYDWRTDERTNFDLLITAIYNAFRDNPEVEGILSGETPVEPPAREALKKAADDTARSIQRFTEAASGEFEALASFLLGGPSETDSSLSLNLLAAAEAVVQGSSLMTDKARAASAPYDNRMRLMQVGLAIGMYEADNDEALPGSLEQLLKSGHLKGDSVMTSARTGKPFVYIGAGLKAAELPPDDILAYDPERNADGTVTALFNDLHVGSVPFSKIEQQTKGR